MPIFVQNILITLFLKPISKLTCKFSEKVKDTMFVLGLLFLILIQFADSSGLIHTRFIILFIPTCFCFFMMFLGGLSSDIKAVKFNSVISCCWYGMVAFMLLSSIFVSFDYIAHVIIWGIIFPVIFIAWGNNNYKRLVKLIIITLEISFVIFLLISFFLFRFKTSEYKAFFLNQNGNAAYTVPVLLSSIVHIISVKNSIKKIIFPCIITGAAFSNILYSSSRASMLAIFGAILVAVILYTYLNRNEIKNIFIYKILPMVLSVIVLFTVLPTIFSFGYSSMRFIHNNKIHYIIKSNIEKMNEPIIFDTVYLYDEDSIDFDDPDAEIDLDELATNDGVIGGIMDHFDMSGGLTNFSNGRFGLWKLYAKELSFLGNPTNKVLINVYGEEEFRESHLTPLQFSYEFGFLTGILYLIINAISGFLALSFAIKRKGKDYSLFPVTIAIGYCILSVLEVMMSPVTRLIVTVYLLSQAIIITKPIQKSED